MWPRTLVSLARRHRRWGLLTAGALTVALATGGVALAASGPSGSPSAGASGGSANPAAPRPGPGRLMPPLFGRFGGRLGGQVLHGQFVTANPSGGYQTVYEQLGTVQSVSASSITVRSADGYQHSYPVGSGTLVDAGRSGIGSVKDGDTVQLTAVQRGSSTSTVSISDLSLLRSAWQHWAPPRQSAPPSGSVWPGQPAPPTSGSAPSI